MLGLVASSTTTSSLRLAIKLYVLLAVDEKTEALAKGGCGCLIAFLVIGLFVVLIGGSAHIDIGGAIILFVIGGVIGWIVLSIYNKGKNSKP